MLRRIDQDILMVKKHISEQQKTHAVKSFNSGQCTVAELAKAFGVERSTVYGWINTLRDRRSLSRIHNPASGRQSKINGTNVKKVLAILKKPASAFGYETDFWTTLRIQQVLYKQLQLKLSRMAIHRTLKKFRQSYKKPETRYYHKNKDKDLKEWRTKSVPAIKRIMTRYNAILYFEDESNVSLTPTVAKTWGPIGEKIIQKVSPNRGSVSAISAISKSGYLIFNVHDKNKRFNSDDIIGFLGQMLQHHKRRHLVVVMDQAPCHRSKKVRTYVKSQKRLHIFYLPPRCPEFNPGEKVWDHLKQHELKGHKIISTKDLKKSTKKKLRKMAKDKMLMLGVYNRSDGARFF